MRANAYVRVSCDKCGYETDIELTPTASRGWDERYVNQFLKGEGWSTTDGDFCEDCLPEDLSETSESNTI